MIKAVLFDLDDTLFDHRYAARCVLNDLREGNAALREFRLEVLEEEDFRLLQEKHQLVLAGAMSIDEARQVRVRSLFSFCGVQLSHEETAELSVRRQVVYRQSRRPVPGAIALLQAVREHAKVGVVTNNLTDEQRDKLMVCGLTSLVDVLATSEEIGHAKPSPMIFQAALDRLKCKSSEAVMIGDSWETDVIGAIRSGILPVWFNRNGISSPDPEVLETPALEPVDQILSLIGVGEMGT